MNFNQYQKEAFGTAIFPEFGPLGLGYPFMGLAGETGEACEKYKKFSRDNTDPLLFREDVKKELGDVLWYLAALATKMDMSLEDIALTNINKLKSRKNRDMLHGAGDNR